MGNQQTTMSRKKSGQTPKVSRNNNNRTKKDSEEKKTRKSKKDLDEDIVLLGDSQSSEDGSDDNNMTSPVTKKAPTVTKKRMGPKSKTQPDKTSPVNIKESSPPPKPKKRMGPRSKTVATSDASDEPEASKTPIVNKTKKSGPKSITEKTKPRKPIAKHVQSKEKTPEPSESDDEPEENKTPSPPAKKPRGPKKPIVKEPSSSEDESGKRKKSDDEESKKEEDNKKKSSSKSIKDKVKKPTANARKSLGTKFPEHKKASIESSTSRPSTSSSIPSPSSDGLKIKAFTSIPKTKRDRSPTASVSSNSDQKTSKSGRKRKKAEPLPPLIPTRVGPRASLIEDPKVEYRVARVLKKWVGPSDRGIKDDVFYLVQWEGHPKPSLTRAPDELWLHESQFEDCNDLMEVVDDEYDKEKKEKMEHKKKRQPNWVMVSEDEYEEEMKKKEVDIDGIEAAGKILRKRDPNLTFNESSQSDSKNAPARKRVVKPETREPIGYERGLPLESIVGMTQYHGKSAYICKFEGSNKADLIPTKIIKGKDIHKLLDFLEERMDRVEDVEESDLTPEALAMVEAARKNEEKILSLLDLPDDQEKNVE